MSEFIKTYPLVGVYDVDFIFNGEEDARKNYYLCIIKDKDQRDEIIFYYLLFSKYLNDDSVFLNLSSSNFTGLDEKLFKSLYRFFRTNISKAIPALNSFLPVLPATFVVGPDFSLNIVADFNLDLLSHGILPLEESSLRDAVSLIDEITFDSTYVYTDTTLGSGNINFGFHVKNPGDLSNHWTQEELDNIEYNKKKYGRHELPIKYGIPMLSKMISAGLVDTCLFYGPAATFKTTTAFILSVLHERPAEIMSIHSGTEAEDVMVSVQPKPSGVNTLKQQQELEDLSNELRDGKISPEQFASISNAKFGTNLSGVQLQHVYSVLLRRFERGGYGIADEMNNGMPSIFGAWNNMLDGTDKITTIDGRTIYKHPSFVFIACINPLYQDKQDLEEAMVTRFKNVVRFFDLDQEEFIKIMKGELPGFSHTSYLELVFEFFKKINNLVEQYRYKYALSFREIKEFVVQSTFAFSNGFINSPEDVSDLVNLTMLNKIMIKERDKTYEDFIKVTENFTHKFFNFLSSLSMGGGVTLKEQYIKFADYIKEDTNLSSADQVLENLINEQDKILGDV